MNKNDLNTITALTAKDILLVEGGKCMFCKWLNDHVGKPVFEKGGQEAVKAFATVLPIIVVDKTISSLEKKEEK